MSRISPRITVATIVERDNRFLMVREQINGHLKYNQPTGHVEHGETLVAAAQREALEETAWQLHISHLVGTFIFQAGTQGPLYYRYCFVGEPIKRLDDYQLDSDIYDNQWLTADEIFACEEYHRSPLVTPCLQQYLAGIRLPLEAIYEHPWPTTI